VTRNQKILACGAVAGAAALAFWWIQRRAEADRSTHDWGDPQQPATGAAGELTTPFPRGADPVAGFLSCRPGTPHMNRGARVLRHYPSTLVDDPESMVR